MASSVPAINEKMVKELNPVFQTSGTTGVINHLEKKLKCFQNTAVDIAVTGESGTGKSSLINALLAVLDTDQSAAPVDVKETTLRPVAYKHKKFPNVVFWDLPGIGTLNFPACDYLERLGILRFDFFLICGIRFTENDAALAKVILIAAWSLQCYECQGLIDNCLISPVTCKPQEPYCILKAYRVIAGGITTDYLMKSCSTGLECGQNTTLYTGYQAIYATSTCCEYDFCNAGAIQITVFSNYLQCYSCTGYKEDSCTSSSAINCIGVENQCVDVSTLVASGSSTTSSIIKGCGNGAFCNDLQAYNTGDSFSVVNVTCCNTAKCNNRQFSASLPTNINGIRCYSCYETGKNECSANNKSQVNCTGGLYRCMEVLDNNNGKQVALMRGCATESFCRGVIPSLTVPQSQQVLCCTGNLCNNWIFNGYQQTGKGHCLQTLNILYLLILLLPSVTVL